MCMGGCDGNTVNIAQPRPSTTKITDSKPMQFGTPSLIHGKPRIVKAK